jgi:phosphatidylglycerophosphate synthase
MTPNQITAARMAMAFSAVLLFGRSPWADLIALLFTAAAIGLDAVDGYIARRKKMATSVGAQLDILGDRVVENLFFTFFAVTGLISLWVPVFFFVRGTLTDFLRSLATRAGRSGFGKNSMLQSWWGRALVASRASRAAYGTLKCVCFCYLGLELTLRHAQVEKLGSRQVGLLHAGTLALVAATVTFCAVRAVPVLWEGRRYLATSSLTGAQAASEASR